MAAVIASLGGGGGGGVDAGANMWNYHNRRANEDQPPGSPRSPRGNIGSPRKSKELAFGKTLDTLGKAEREKGSKVSRGPLRAHLSDDGAVIFSGGDSDSESSIDDGDAMRATIAGDTDISQVVAYAKILEYDRSIRMRNLFNLFIAVLSAICFMAEIWMAYSEDKCWGDWPPLGRINPDTGSEYVVDDIDSRMKDCLQRTTNTWLMKCFISSLTGLLTLSLIDYYRLQLSAEKRYWFMSDSFEWRRYVVVFFAVEMIVCMPHPFPLPDSLAGMYDDKLGAFMFCRLYLFFRVLRDHSPIYRQRKLLFSDQSLKKSGAVEFNWMLSTRFLFMDHMWAFVGWAVMITWFTMAYVIWIFEREHNKFFTIDISVWFTCITMTTVGYGDVNVSNGSARVITGFTVIFGLILGALLAYVVMYNLTLSPQDVRVRNLWIKKKEEDKQKVTAAQYIASAWEFYKEKRVVSDRTSYEFRKLRKNFLVRNTFFKSRLRSHRREITMANELDDFVITRLETRMDSMTEDIAERLGYRLGVVEAEPEREEEIPLDEATVPQQAKVKKKEAPHNAKPNHCLGLLASVAQRIEGMEVEQEVTLRELDKLCKFYDGKGWW